VRRFGNLVSAASNAGLPNAELAGRAAADPFPARVVHGEDLAAFVAGKRPVTDVTAGLSPVPPGVFAPSADHPGTPAWRR
jgi:hypothetical protein